MVNGVILVLFTVLVPIAAPMSPIIVVRREDLTVGRRTTQRVRVVAEVAVMAVVTTVAAGLPQWTVSCDVSDIR